MSEGLSYHKIDNILTVKQRYRSGKRPFRTFHKAPVKSLTYGGQKLGSKVTIEYDEIDNDELTIFESWVRIMALSKILEFQWKWPIFLPLEKYSKSFDNFWFKKSAISVLYKFAIFVEIDHFLTKNSRIYNYQRIPTFTKTFKFYQYLQFLPAFLPSF